MAVNIPGLRQVRKTNFMDEAGDKGLTVQYKHTSYAELYAAAEGIGQGYEIETGWVVKTWTVEGVPGGGGLLSVNCIPKDSYTPSEGSATQYPKDETWTCKSVRNDVSILAYCGTGSDNPNRTWIELWQKETDESVARSGNYTKPDGTVSDLAQEDFAAATSELIAKINKGVESVMRFYPVLSRNRKYDTCPTTMLENLGFIDTPPTPGTNIDNPNIPESSRKKIKKPNNLSGIIGAHQWLKVQDDVTEQGDGSFVRTESWMGIPTSDNESPWDADLYGTERWPMPYAH